MLVRELTAADRPALAFIFHRLGENSRYQRFHGAKRQLSAKELDCLTAVDHWHHEALIAWTPAPSAPVAVARYVRTADFDLAELAVTVVDEWQRRGVGVELLLALRERALRAGITRFTATALRSNRAALALARRVGPLTVVAAHGDVVEVLLSLRPSPAGAYPSSRAPSGTFSRTVTSPRTFTSRPKRTSPSTTSRSHSASDGGPAGKRASKSPSSLK
jgi:RimJ/RimL family protein N-acetyltransferase